MVMEMSKYKIYKAIVIEKYDDEGKQESFQILTEKEAKLLAMFMRDNEEEKIYG